MRAIYRRDGTIKLCGDYPENVSAEITQDQADNKELYRVNPNTKVVYAVPTCAAKYRKVVDDVILEMSVEEKAAVDAAEAAIVVAQAKSAVINRLTGNMREVVNLKYARLLKKGDVINALKLR